jgi:hypothetical protein
MNISMNALLPVVALIVVYSQFSSQHMQNQAYPQQAQTGLQVHCPNAPLILCANDDRVTLPPDNQIFSGEEDSLSISCHVHVKLELTVESDQDSISYSVGYFEGDGAEFSVLQENISIAIDSGSATMTLNTAETATEAIRAMGLAYNSVCANADGGFHRIVWTVHNGSRLDFIGIKIGDVNGTFRDRGEGVARD